MFPAGKQTLKSLLERSRTLYQNRPAISFVDEPPITYGELGRRVSLLSNELILRGIQAGDRIAILSENKPNWGIAFFAVTIIGAVAVPILPDFQSNDVNYILNHAEVKGLFVSEKQMPKIAGNKPESLATSFLIDDFSLLSEGTSSSLTEEIINGAFKEGETIALPDYEPSEDQLATVIYTSGTTGHSKGVMLSHLNFIFDVIATLKIQPVHWEDRLLSILPLSHAYEFTIGFLIPMSKGASVFYLGKPPVPGVLLPALATVRPTMMMTVPLIIEKIYRKQIYPTLMKSALSRTLMKIPPMRKMLHTIAAKKVYKLFGGKLHFFGIGGALLAADVERFLRDGKFPYAIGYGLTETAPLIAGCSPKVTKYRSTGVVIPDVEVQIHDPNPETGEGEIWVRGQNVMKGYYKDEARTREVLTEDGWFNTGDLGLLDADGYLFIKGRSKNVILGPSGENIYPEELESLFNKSDYVLESLVYQEENQLTASVFLNYEKINAETMLKSLTESETAEYVKRKLEEIRHSVNSNIAGFLRIKKIKETKEPFEKTATQKIKRFLYHH